MLTRPTNTPIDNLSLFTASFYQVPPLSKQEEEIKLDFPLPSSPETLQEFIQAHGRHFYEEKASESTTKSDQSFWLGVTKLVTEFKNWIDQTQWEVSEYKNLEMQNKLKGQLDLFLGTHFKYTGSNPEYNKNFFAFYHDGIPLLAKIVNNLESTEYSLELKKHAVLNLIIHSSGLNVCEPGVYLNIYDASLEFSHDLALYLMNVRRQLAEAIAKELLNQHATFEPTMQGNEIHYINHIVNHFAGVIGVNTIEDPFATNIVQANIMAMLNELKEEFIKSFYNLCTAQFIVQSCIEKINYPELVKDYVDGSGEEIASATLSKIETALRFFGEDIYNNKNNLSLEDFFEVREGSNHFEYFLKPIGIQSILFHSIFQRLINLNIFSVNDALKMTCNIPDFLTEEQKDYQLAAIEFRAREREVKNEPFVTESIKNTESLAIFFPQISMEFAYVQHGATNKRLPLINYIVEQLSLHQASKDLEEESKELNSFWETLLHFAGSKKVDLIKLSINYFHQAKDDNLLSYFINFVMKYDNSRLLLDVVGCLFNISEFAIFLKHVEVEHLQRNINERNANYIWYHLPITLDNDSNDLKKIIPILFSFNLHGASKLKISKDDILAKLDYPPSALSGPFFERQPHRLINIALRFNSWNWLEGFMDRYLNSFPLAALDKLHYEKMLIHSVLNDKQNMVERIINLMVIEANPNVNHASFQYLNINLVLETIIALFKVPEDKKALDIGITKADKTKALLKVVEQASMDTVDFLLVKYNILLANANYEILEALKIKATPDVFNTALLNFFGNDFNSNLSTNVNLNSQRLFYLDYFDNNKELLTTIFNKIDTKLLSRGEQLLFLEKVVRNLEKINDLFSKFSATTIDNKNLLEWIIHLNDGLLLKRVFPYILISDDISSYWTLIIRRSALDCILPLSEFMPPVIPNLLFVLIDLLGRHDRWNLASSLTENLIENLDWKMLVIHDANNIKLQLPPNFQSELFSSLRADEYRHFIFFILLSLSSGSPKYYQDRLLEVIPLANKKTLNNLFKSEFAHLLALKFIKEVPIVFVALSKILDQEIISALLKENLGDIENNKLGFHHFIENAETIEQVDQILNCLTKSNWPELLAGDGIFAFLNNEDKNVKLHIVSKLPDDFLCQHLTSYVLIKHLASREWNDYYLINYVKPLIKYCAPKNLLAFAVPDFSKYLFVLLSDILDVLENDEAMYKEFVKSCWCSELFRYAFFKYNLKLLETIAHFTMDDSFRNESLPEFVKQSVTTYISFKELTPELKILIKIARHAQVYLTFPNDPTRLLIDMAIQTEQVDFLKDLAHCQGWGLAYKRSLSDGAENFAYISKMIISLRPALLRPFLVNESEQLLQSLLYYGLKHNLATLINVAVQLSGSQTANELLGKLIVSDLGRNQIEKVETFTLFAIMSSCTPSYLYNMVVKGYPFFSNAFKEKLQSSLIHKCLSYKLPFQILKMPFQEMALHDSEVNQIKTFTQQPAKSIEQCPIGFTSFVRLGIQEDENILIDETKWETNLCLALAHLQKLSEQSKIPPLDFVVYKNQLDALLLRLPSYQQEEMHARAHPWRIQAKFITAADNYIVAKTLMKDPQSTISTLKALTHLQSAITSDSNKKVYRDAFHGLLMRVNQECLEEKTSSTDSVNYSMFNKANTIIKKYEMTIAKLEEKDDSQMYQLIISATHFLQDYAYFSKEDKGVSSLRNKIIFLLGAATMLEAKQLILYAALTESKTTSLMKEIIKLPHFPFNKHEKLLAELEGSIDYRLSKVNGKWDDIEEKHLQPLQAGIAAKEISGEDCAQIINNFESFLQLKQHLHTENPSLRESKQ